MQQFSLPQEANLFWVLKEWLRIEEVMLAKESLCTQRKGSNGSRRRALNSHSRFQSRESQSLTWSWAVQGGSQQLHWPFTFKWLHIKYTLKFSSSVTLATFWVLLRPKQLVVPALGSALWAHFLHWEILLDGAALSRPAVSVVQIQLPACFFE